MATYNYPHIAPFNAHHAPHPSIIALTQQPIHYANLQRTALEWLHDLLPRMRIGMPSFSDAPDCLSRLNAGETCAKIIRLAQLVRDRNGTTADPTIDNIPDTTVHIIFFMLHIYDHAHFIVPPRVERIQWDYAMYGETTSSHHIFSFVERTRHNYRVADEFATKSGNIRHRIDTNDGIPREMYCGIPYTQQHIRDRVEQLFHEIECCYNTDIAVIQADVDFITENSRYLAAQLVTIASALSEIARWFYPDAYCVFRKGLSFASNLPQPDTLQYPQHIFNNFAYPYTASSMHAFAEAIRIERRPYEERHLSYECTIDFSGSWIDPPRNTSAHTPDLDEDTLDILVDRMRSTDTPGILTPVTSLDDLFYIPALAMYIIPVHRMHTRAKTPFIYVRNAHPATKHTNHATLIAERLCALPNMAYLKPIIMAAETQLGILKACIQHAFLFASHPLFPSFTADPRKNTITKMFRVRSTVPITAPPRIDDDDDDNVSIASDSEDEDDSNKKTIASTVVAAANLTHVVAAATASGVTGAVIAASLAVPVLASLAVTGIAHAIYGPTVLVPPLSPPPRVRREHHPPARRTRHVDADDPPPPPPPQIIPATPYELDELHERKHARPSSRLFDVTHHTLVIPKTKFILASVIEDNNISAHDMHTIVATIYNHIHVYVTTTTVRADTTRSGVPLLHFRPYAPTNAPGLFYSKTDPTNKRVPLFIPAALYRIPRSASCIAAVLTAYTTITTLASDINAILTLVDHMHTVATPVASEHTRYTPLTVLFYSATNTQCAVFHAYMKQCLVLGRKHPPKHKHCRSHTTPSATPFAPHSPSSRAHPTTQTLSSLHPRPTTNTSSSTRSAPSRPRPTIHS